MTMPVTHGYPDWARQTAEADIQVYYQQNVALNALAVSAPIFVGGMTALYAVYNGQSTRNRVQFRFFFDQACTQEVDTDGITVSANGFYSGPVAVFGPWLQLTFEADAYPSTYSLRVALAPEFRAPTGQNATAGQLLHASPQNVAAATNVDVISNITWRGPAIFYAETPAIAGAAIRLYHRRFDGSLILIYQIPSPGGRETVQLALQTSIITVRLENPAGAARDFFYALNAKRPAG